MTLPLKHFKNPFVLIISFLWFAVSACKKESKGENLSGNYRGFFIKHSGAPNVDPARATVVLTFDEKSFTGSSNIDRYPAICHGNYTTSNGFIKIENQCFYTADFDWTLIFSNEYKYSFDGNELRIWRDYANGRQDEYLLQKQ